MFGFIERYRRKQKVKRLFSELDWRIEVSEICSRGNAYGLARGFQEEINELFEEIKEVMYGQKKV